MAFLNSILISNYVSSQPWKSAYVLFFFLSHLVFTILDLSVENFRIICEVCTLGTSLQEEVKVVWYGEKCAGYLENLDSAIIYFSNFE